MSTSSRIADIVDYTAVIAAGIEGVKVVAAAGQGYYDDPLRPGQKIAAAPEANTNPYTHWSEVPSAPEIMWVSQQGGVELTWTIPMRLWLPKTNAEARRTALPFYDRYLRAFVLRPTIDGLALRSAVSRFVIGGDKDWSWLDTGLMVVERVTYVP